MRRLDLNNNGLIDPIELKYSLKEFGVTMTEEECHQILKYFDPDRTGKLSVNEFLHIIRDGNYN